MNHSELTQTVDALDIIATNLDVSVDDIVDALTGITIDEEDASELLEYHRYHY